MLSTTSSLRLATLRRCTVPVQHVRNVSARFQGSDKTDAPSFPFSRPAETVPPEEYAKMRKECPFAKAKLFDGSLVNLITRHKDVKTVLQDDRFSKVRTHPNFPELSAGGKAAAQSSAEATFVDMDPPEHTKHRGMVARWFTREKGEEMRPSIKAKVNELLDQMEAKGSKPLDLQENFSMPLAFKVIYEMLGIPFSDYHYLSSTAAVRSSGSSTAKDAGAAAQDLQKYMEDLVAKKEQNPGNDIISALIKEQLQPGHINRDQLIQTAFLLLVAGNATVAGQINLAVLTLLQHPDQLEDFKKHCNDSKYLFNAVEETLRFHTASAYALRRIAKEDVKLDDGTVVKKDHGIVALNQSANRDETVFQNPDKFDLRRDASAQLGFGYGTHVCIAEWLARVELQEALRGLFTRFPNLKLAVPLNQVQYSPPDKDVGVAKLPITW